MKYVSTLYLIAQLFMLVCSIVASVTGILNRHKHPNLKIFYFYPLASFIQMLIYFTAHSYPFSKKTNNDIIIASANIFMVVEFLIICHFFLHTLKSRSHIKVLYSIMVVYMVAAPLYLVFVNGFFSLPDNFFFIESLFILMPVFFYFIELFKWPPTRKLWELPSFWITTGVAFYFGCTLPLFLMADFIIIKNRFLKEMNMYLINFIAYSVLFLFIAKAYLCPKGDTP